MNSKLIVAALGIAFSVVGCTPSQPTETAAPAIDSKAEQNARDAEKAEEEAAMQAALDKKDGKKDGQKDGRKAGRKPASESWASKTESSKTSNKASKGEGNREPKAVARTSRGPMVYIVQVGAFKVRENADKLQSKLKGEGFPVIVRELNHSKNGSLHLVRLEPTPSRAEAEQWVAQLKSKTQVDAQLLSQADSE